MSRRHWSDPRGESCATGSGHSSEIGVRSATRASGRNCGGTSKRLSSQPVSRIQGSAVRADHVDVGAHELVADELDLPPST